MRLGHVAVGLVGLGLGMAIWAQNGATASRFSPDLGSLKARAKQLGVKWSGMRVFIRAFKQERELEVWISNGDTTRFKLLATYPIAGMSGGSGPKRKQGDRQVPEGFYVVDRFNPNSRFHLSLGIDYPNRSDRIRGDKVDPGGDIFIHGSNVSIGCLAMTNQKIEEIYAIAKLARDRGQSQIQVHIFPTRLESSPYAELVKQLPMHAKFWQELKVGYDKFDSTGIPSLPNVNEINGAYEWD